MHAAHHTGASMALAHGLATLVTVVLVRQANAAVHTIADLLRTLLDALLPTLGTPRVLTTYPRLAIRATVAPVLTGHRQRRRPRTRPTARASGQAAHRTSSQQPERQQQTASEPDRTPSA
ncbi:hypothetical protein BJF86_07915 [Serinicoccus sp. CNJ-927]|nr:hypothetical protein BJF86_07915 [Serinicoccus sp. CNJ-927]